MTAAHVAATAHVTAAAHVAASAVSTESASMWCKPVYGSSMRESSIKVPSVMFKTVILKVAMPTAETEAEERSAVVGVESVSGISVSVWVTVSVWSVVVVVVNVG